MLADRDAIKTTAKYSIRETMSLLGIKSHNTLEKYVTLGLIQKHRHATGKPYFKGQEIINFSNQSIF